MSAQQSLAGDFFWFIAILTILFWAGVWVAYIVRHDRIEQMPDPQQPQPHECNITGCHRPAATAFPTGVTGCTYYACTGHTPMVRNWIGPYDHDVPYDQELDTIDLALWELEQ
jgi:hypothetical protein